MKCKYIRIHLYWVAYLIDFMNRISQRIFASLKILWFQYDWPHISISQKCGNFSVKSRENREESLFCAIVSVVSMIAFVESVSIKCWHKSVKVNRWWNKQIHVWAWIAHHSKIVYRYGYASMWLYVFSETKHDNSSKTKSNCVFMFRFSMWMMSSKFHEISVLFQLNHSIHMRTAWKLLYLAEIWSQSLASHSII